jgi:hypothetical protein
MIEHKGETMTQFPDLFAELCADFHPSEIKERDAERGGGRKLKYVQAATVKNRLDTVLGPEGWWSRYIPLDGAVECQLTIRLPDGTTVTKTDAGSGKDAKAAYSDSLKRAAEQFGIARYLRQCGVPRYTASPGAPSQAHPSRTSDADSPIHRPREERRERHDDRQPPAERRQYDGPPKSGKALFSFAKDAEQRYQVGLLRFITNWAKLQEFPPRMVDFDADQVALAYAEIQRKLQSIEQTGEVEPALAN